MKKIFLTISQGWIARNFLQNDFYKILREKYEIVILTPAYNDERFLKEFGHSHVRFLSYPASPWNRLDLLMFNLHRMLVWNRSVELHLRYGVAMGDKEQPAWLFYLIKGIFWPLSKIKVLRNILQWLDYRFLQKGDREKFCELIKKEGPDLIIVTHPTEDSGAALMKAARKLGTACWAMPKSWDNLSKSGFRARADRLVVWSEYMRDLAVRYQNYHPSKVDVVGILQYDVFFEKDRLQSYSDFCNSTGLSSDRKTIFFGSEGKLFPYDKDIASMLYEMIEKNELQEPCQLLLRPHYGHKNDEQKFAHLVGKPHVAIDLYNIKSKGFKDEWDYSEAFTNRWLNSLYHSAVVINNRSSLSIDAAALDIPAINIIFDGYQKKLPYGASARRMNDYDFYKAVLDTNATAHVYSREELKNAVNDYLKNPGINRKGRGVLRDQCCGPLDGNTGRRFANFVIQFLD